jgi:hypothetical protein
MEKVYSILKMAPIIKVLLYQVLLKVKVDISIIMDVFIKVRSKIIKHQGKVAILINIKDIIIKEIGSKMFHQDMVNKNLQMVPIIKDNLKTVLKMVQEDIFLILESIKANLN